MSDTHILTNYKAEFDEIHLIFRQTLELFLPFFENYVGKYFLSDPANAYGSDDIHNEIKSNLGEIDNLIERYYALRNPNVRQMKALNTLLRTSAMLAQLSDTVSEFSLVTKKLNSHPQLIRDFEDGRHDGFKNILSRVSSRIAHLHIGYINADKTRLASVQDIDALRSICNAFERESLTYMMEDPSNISPMMAMQRASRLSMQIGEWLKSIATEFLSSDQSDKLNAKQANDSVPRWKLDEIKELKELLKKYTWDRNDAQFTGNQIQIIGMTEANFNVLVSAIDMTVRISKTELRMAYMTQIEAITQILISLRPMIQEFYKTTGTLAEPLSGKWNKLLKSLMIGSDPDKDYE